MASAEQSTNVSAAPNSDFSLVLGGPLFQLLRRARLSDNALTLVRKRIVVIALIAWVPLALLSTLEGNALRGMQVPFLLDFEIHIRFLLALPLLIAAELVVHSRMRSILQVFRDRELVPESETSRFEAAVASAMRWRNSMVTELSLIVLVYGLGIQVVWREFLSLGTETWFAIPSANGGTLSLAGYWFGYVSLPIYQFLLLRWYFRLFIWGRFLWQISKVKLDLVPTHPDRLGGLGFLANSVHAFTPLAVAHGAVLAGMIANRIFYMGAKLTDFKAQAALLVFVMLCLVFGPLLVFASQLAEARRKGLREYGSLAQRYVREFDRKWLRGGAPAEEAFIGTADVQSLADLGNSYEVVKTMRTVPVTKEAVFQLALVTLAPLAPLALTMMPLEQLLKGLFGLLF
jgi:hypothetical protein